MCELVRVALHLVRKSVEHRRLFKRSHCRQHIQPTPRRRNRLIYIGRVCLPATHAVIGVSLDGLLKLAAKEAGGEAPDTTACRCHGLHMAY